MNYWELRNKRDQQNPSSVDDGFCFILKYDIIIVCLI